MKHFGAVASACAWLCLIGAGSAQAQSGPATPSSPQPSSLQETYDDWLVVCRTLADRKRQCSMVQNQVDGKTKQRVLTLELAAGTAERLGIRVGDKVEQRIFGNS